MPKKMLKADYVELIEKHFAAQGKKMSNLSKATLPRLKEIIKEHNIEYDEKTIVAENEELKIKQKKEKEEQEKKWADAAKKVNDEKQTHKELWASLSDDDKDNIVMFLVIKKHKHYLDYYWRNKKANKRLVAEVDKMEALFKEDVGEDKVERKGLDRLCVKGVNIHHGFLHEDWNQENEIKEAKIDAENGWRCNIDDILKQIKEEELKEREKGCLID